MSAVLPCRRLMLALMAGSLGGCTGKSQDTVATPPVSVDELVAPIALYPDQLLGQILVVATEPQEVMRVRSWVLANRGLEGDALSGAATRAGFRPSAQYLAHFPAVVDNMYRQLDWTTQLGQALRSNQQGVMDAVQRKRQQAQRSGSLVSGPEMVVLTRQASNGDSYIEIAPGDPKLVYIPKYDPMTVYVTAPTTGRVTLGEGTAVGSTHGDNNESYPYLSWDHGSMYYGGRPYDPPPYSR